MTECRFSSGSSSRKVLNMRYITMPSRNHSILVLKRLGFPKVTTQLQLDNCQVVSTFILVVGQGKVPSSIFDYFELQFKPSGPQPDLKIYARAMDSMRLPFEECVIIITFHGSDLRVAKTCKFLV
jgi:hypothetical protein